MIDERSKPTVGIDPEIDKFLCDSSNYKEIYRHYPETGPLVSEPISVIGTHCARLYLSSYFVVKIKKAVSYSYIDLGSLNDRWRTCMRELEVNQPTLPDIYLNIIAIVASESGKLRFSFKPQYLDSGDHVREWCLVMRRFDESTVLDRIAQRGEFTSELAQHTGKSIAQYHDQLPQLSRDDGDTRIEEIIHELDFELHKLKSLFSPGKVSQLIRMQYNRCTAIRPLLKQRAKTGFIRRCHGDLHLRNMILHEGNPVPFDALEFDERLATIDVLYDLAFLIMDLCHRDLIQQANIALNEYLLRTVGQNVAGASLMGLFISMRAGIKAMTTAQGITSDASASASAADPTRALSAKQSEALSYFELAHEALQPIKPIIVAIGGFSGSGKSTVSKQLPTKLSPLPGALLLQSDAERKDEFDVGNATKLPPEHYTASNSQRVYDRLFDKIKLALLHCYPIIVDATFLSADRRREVEELAATAGVEFHGFWLMAPVDVMKSRIKARGAGLSDADVSVLEKQLKRHKGRIGWQHIDTSGSVDSTIECIMEKLSQEKQKSAETVSSGIEV